MVSLTATEASLAGVVVGSVLTFTFSSRLSRNQFKIDLRYRGMLSLVDSLTELDKQTDLIKQKWQDIVFVARENVVPNKRKSNKRMIDGLENLTSLLYDLQRTALAGLPRNLSHILFYQILSRVDSADFKELNLRASIFVKTLEKVLTLEDKTKLAENIIKDDKDIKESLKNIDTQIQRILGLTNHLDLISLIVSNRFFNSVWKQRVKEKFSKDGAA